MATTEAQLVSRVLGILRARGSGQTGNAEDIATITAMIPDALSALQKSVYIPDSDSVPDGSVFWVASFIAQMASDEFGLPMDPAKMAQAEARLCALHASGPTYETLAADYF
jgi:hypothetical protein